MLVSICNLGFAPRWDHQQIFTTPRSEGRLPEPGWHRRERRQRFTDRAVVLLAKSAGRLNQHHGSASGMPPSGEWQEVDDRKRGNGHKQKLWVACKGCCDGSCDSWVYLVRLDAVGSICKTCGEEWPVREPKELGRSPRRQLRPRASRLRSR